MALLNMHLFFFCLSCTISVCTSLATSVPLLLWSSDTTFNDQYSSINLDTLSLSSSLSSIADMETKTSFILNQAMSEEMRQLEYFVLFLVPSLRTDLMSEMKNGALSALLSSASSTCTLLHTARSVPLSSVLEMDETISYEKAASFFEKNGMGKNLKVGTIVITLPSDVSLTTIDGMIADMVQEITSSTDGDVAFGFTGDMATPLLQTSVVSAASRRYLQDTTAPATPAPNTLTCPPGYILKNDTKFPYCFSHFVHMTPTIMAGIFIGFIFLFITIVGLTCMHGIETPTRFTLIAPPLGKEF